VATWGTQSSTRTATAEAITGPRIPFSHSSARSRTLPSRDIDAAVATTAPAVGSWSSQVGICANGESVLMVYRRATNLDRHPNYRLAAFMASGT